MQYHETVEPLEDKAQTAAAMKFLVRRFSKDLDHVYVQKNRKMVPVSSLTLEEYFSVVKDIPYRMDKKPVEVVARPRITFENRSLGADCKKKGIAMAAYCQRKRIPWRFVGSSRRPDKRIHHVFTQAMISGRWQNIDATYPHYRPYQHKEVTAAEIL